MNIAIRESQLPGDVGGLFAVVPELGSLSSEEVVSRIGSDNLLVVAVCDEEIVGFKLGYPISPTQFYSWIGGVSPKARRLGVGRRLLRLQEELVRSRGFEVLRVKSMNRFPSMLSLLIAEGYAITAVEGTDSETLKIVFEKRLS